MMRKIIILLGIMLLIRVSEGSRARRCRKAIKTLGNCLKRGYNSIPGCPADVPATLPASLTRFCGRMNARAGRKCGGYQCGGRSEWTEAQWPSKDAPNGSDDEGTPNWIVETEPVAVNIGAGETVVFNTRMNPLRSWPQERVGFYFLHETEGLNDAGYVMAKAVIMYNPIAAENGQFDGFGYYRAYLTVRGMSNCYLVPTVTEDLSSLADLEDFTVKVDFVRGSFTITGTGLDVVISLAEENNFICYRNAIQAGITQIRTKYTVNRNNPFLPEWILVETKAKVQNV